MTIVLLRKRHHTPVRVEHPGELRTDWKWYEEASCPLLTAVAPALPPAPRLPHTTLLWRMRPLARAACRPWCRAAPLLAQARNSKLQVRRAAWDFCRSYSRRAVSAPPRPLLSSDREANGGGSDCCTALHLPSTPTLPAPPHLSREGECFWGEAYLVLQIKDYGLLSVYVTINRIK